MHIRFACDKSDKRCVAYSQPDTDEQDPKPTLRPGSNKPGGGSSKLPGKGSKGSTPKAKNSGKKKRIRPKKKPR